MPGTDHLLKQDLLQLFSSAIHLKTQLAQSLTSHSGTVVNKSFYQGGRISANTWSSSLHPTDRQHQFLVSSEEERRHTIDRVLLTRTSKFVVGGGRFVASLPGSPSRHASIIVVVFVVVLQNMKAVLIQLCNTCATDKAVQQMCN